MNIIAETERLSLRGWQESDRAPFADMNRHPSVMKYLGPPLPRRESDAAIDKQKTLMIAGEPAFWAVAGKSDQKFMGCIGVKRVTFEAPFTRSDKKPCFEIGWRLAQPFWGQGYASEGAIGALFAAFKGWDMDHIYSFTVPANKASQRVMEKIGMHRVKDGDFDHPNLIKSDPILRHVLYKIERPEVYL